MKKPTTITSESVSECREFIELRLRKGVLEAIEVVIDEELDQPSVPTSLRHFAP